MLQRKMAWLGRFGRLQLGLCLFGLGIATMLGARIGLDPWSTFHEGLALQVGLSFGRVTQLVGVVFVVLAWMAFGERPGIGTVCNMAFIGPWVDLFRPRLELAEGLGFGIVQFVVGLMTVGLASGLYISARLGAGPRDAFVLGVARSRGWTIRVTRISLEIVVLAIGGLLGGPVGLGTVLFAIAMGPLMQASLRMFRYDNRSRSTADQAPDGGTQALP